MHPGMVQEFLGHNQISTIMNIYGQCSTQRGEWQLTLRMALAMYALLMRRRAILQHHARAV